MLDLESDQFELGQETLALSVEVDHYQAESVLDSAVAQEDLDGFPIRIGFLSRPFELYRDFGKRRIVKVRIEVTSHVLFKAFDRLVAGVWIEQARSDFRVADESEISRVQHLIHGVAVGGRPQLVQHWPVSFEEALYIEGSAIEELEYDQGVLQLGQP